MLPILGAVGSDSALAGQALTLSMQLRMFSELHRISPLRATLAAMLAVLQRLKGLSQGAAPLLPSSITEGATSEDHCSTNEEERVGGLSPTHSSSTRSGSPAESPGSSSSDGHSHSSPAGSQASSEFAALNGNGVTLQRRKSRVSILVLRDFYPVLQCAVSNPPLS